MGEGVILFVMPFDTVNFEYLGEEKVGVGVERMCESSSTTFEVDSVSLVAWPMRQVTFLDGSHLSLCDKEELECGLDGEMVGSDEDINLVVPLARKRKYCMTVRKPKDMSRVPAKLKRMSLQSVQKVSAIDCCSLKCCQFADRVMLMKLRKEFWDQCQEARNNYVYDILGTTQRINPHGKRHYIFALGGKEICCRAWYEMHGIPKTTFYTYKKQFEAGMRMFLHGSTGNIGRSRDHVAMAKSIIREFVKNNAEQMPHKSRTLTDGSRETLNVIPDMYRQVDILNEVNEALTTANYRTLSSSSFNRIWNTDFKYVTLAKTSDFSKCSICSGIKSLLASTKSQEEREKIMEDRRKHMKQQQSCRNLYYTWRQHSHMYPKKYLCIIHDKMDQKKTAIPRLKNRPKDVDNAWQLQVSLTGMITHGHGHGRYGHFTLSGLWPYDPNATIGSLSLCLHNLERVRDHGLGDLGEHGARSNDENSLFDAFLCKKALGDSRSSLQGSNPNIPKDMCEEVQQQVQRRFTALPENLLLQLDNCASENKNRYLFAYLSLLVARGVFKTVTLGFLMVGHTHEDVDAMFSKFSDSLKNSNAFTFPHLMKIFTECEKSCLAPFLLRKVPDFKSFVEYFLCDGQDALVGHSKPLQFRFFMQDNVPIMQYKVHPKIPEWKPTEGIQLWRRDNDGNVMLPQGSPKVLPFEDFVKDNDQVIHGIKDYIRYWEKWVGAKGSESSLGKTMGPVIEYWKQMVVELQKPSIAFDSAPMYEQFWPMSEGSHTTLRDLWEAEATYDKFEGYEEFNDHYCGPRRQRPKESFAPMVDVKKGDFILVRPSDVSYPIWVAVAQTDVDKDPNSANYQKLLIQYWAPVCKKKGASEAEVYENCWDKHWGPNVRDPQVWENVDAIVFSWMPRGQTKNPLRVKIPKHVAAKAQQSLSTTNVDFEDR